MKTTRLAHIADRQMATLCRCPPDRLAIGEPGRTTSAVHSDVAVTAITWTGVPLVRPSSAADPAVWPNWIELPRRNSSALLLPWLSTQLSVTPVPTASCRNDVSFSTRLNGS